MSKISQKDLDKAVEAAKEDFNNNNSLFLEKVGDAFLKIFDHLSEGDNEHQAAFISGQLGYYRRKLIQTVDKTLKQFIDEVQLTADMGKVEIYDIYLKTSECSQELVAYKESDEKKKRFTKGTTIYEYLGSVEYGKKFYTVNRDDDEGNFAEIVPALFRTEEEAYNELNNVSQDEEILFDFFVNEWDVIEETDGTLIVY